MSDPRWPDDGHTWPEHDLREEDERDPWARDPEPSGPHPEGPPEAGSSEAPAPEGPQLEAGEPTTAFDGGSWDPKLHGDRRRPTTAEQAVPWMIGIILALAGILIVLLALIFTTPEGLLGTSGSPTPSASATGVLPSASGTGSGAAQPSRTASPSESVQPSEGPSATPVPEYGPLEMVYLGRPSAVAPIYLLRRDFSEDQEPRIMAQADAGVASYAWSGDGRVGVAIIADRLVALTPGESARALADDISAVTFGWDSDTVYAVRITPDGGNDVAEVIQIDFASGDSSVLGSTSYPRPVIGPDPALREAQFIDNGGLVRLYAVADGNLTVWILGAPATYRVDPGDGSFSEVDREPILWSPDGRQRIDVRENDNGTSDLIVREQSGDSVASMQVTGLVSHVRWVRTGNEIVFTLGRLAANGGVRQDLYVWDLADGSDPLPLTSNGVSFGAEWLGVSPNWLP
ncbi:MAG TPA: hypothetical protein VF071_01800 [Candidatus Limnocylindria bacterium]